MGKTILIIEDDQHFHDLYNAILEFTDYEIICAYDGNEALAKLDETKPDLIILDILLNMVTGDTLFLYLKSIPEYADIPIIIASSASKSNYQNLIKLDQNLVFLEKTLVWENLIEEIRSKIG